MSLGLISGLIIGIIFGFLLKRSRFCATGLIRDMYLEKRGYNMVLIFGIIFIQSFIYHILLQVGILPELYIFEFSFVSVAFGSFIFGFGAVLSNGCMTSTLVKSGDGRTLGLITLLSFIISSYIAIAGPLRDFSFKLADTMKIPEETLWHLPLSPLVISGIGAVVCSVLMYRHYVSHKPKFKIPGRYTGLKHIFLEKIWSREVTVVLIAILMAVSYYFSNLVGRNGSFSISTPILSWTNFICPIDPVGLGWAIDDQWIGWGSMFVLGIVLGSFITTVISKEFKIVLPNKTVLLKTIVGGLLMGFGATWGQGCLIGNGLVATAQLANRGWVGLIFISLGIWVASELFLKVRVKK